MPIIRVDGSRVGDIEKKRNFVKSVTDAASIFYDLPKQTIVVLINENASENVGIGGQLLIDRPASENKK